VSISAPFIRRPIGTTLLTIAVALAGAIGYVFLPVSPLPEVEFPTIQVSASLPGANPETMASSVVTPLERQFGRIAGVTEMTSTSSLGSAQIVLQFDLSRNIDAAARDVQAAINAARSQLPANLPSNPSYRKVNPADAPIMMLALTSNIVDKARMYDVASSVLQQKIAQEPGVGQVVVGGGALPAVRVEVNPTILNANGLSLEDVRTFLAAANANRPKGQVADTTRAWTLDTSDQLRKASEYQPLVISYVNGGALRLSDVATITDSVEDIRTGGLANGKPAVLIIVFRQPGANIIGAVDRITALIPALQASIPPTIRLSVMQDRTTTIRASVRDVEITLCISIALVILVVFLFLRSARSTFIPSVAVPISLVGTFAAMYLFGYSLDNLSLMALTIATGFVVDDAIVVVENITRHLEHGASPLDAALQGAKEIGFTVVSISISLIAVFIPILLMSGIVGRLFREFAVTLSAAIVVSLIISLTTTPMLCARLLRSHAQETPGRLARGSERVFDWIVGRYESSLRVVLRHQALTLLVTLLTMATTVYLYFRVPKGFFPQQDTGRLNGSIQADQNTSFQAMQRRVSEFVTIVMRDPAVDGVLAYVGGGGTQNTARMFVNLQPLGVRKISADQVIARLRSSLAHVPGATLFLQSVQDLRIGGRASAAQYQYTLQGDDVKQLNDWAPKVFAKLRSLPALADVNSDQQTRGLEASLVIDRGTASRLGLSSQDIDNTLYDAFGQRQVSTMYTPLNQYHVVMEADPRFWQSPDGLRYVYVRASDGREVPLSAFTRYTRTTAPLAVNHQGQVPSVTISFNLAPGIALGDAVTAIQSAERDINLPSSIRGSFSGTAQAYQASLASEPILIAAALAAVYLVLGVLYESYIHPLTILSTLPSAGVGALLALMLFRTDLSIIAFIGIILLIGIVKKNAILMIDFALEAERNEGKTPADAIFQACLLRFRPIVMTTMAALLGGVPLAIGLGAGGELRRPLGIAIVGGLLFSQMLTLYTTPVVYLYLDRLRAWRPGRAHLTALAIAVAAMIAGGCVVGPEYKKPPAAQPSTFKELPAQGDLLTSQWKLAQPSDDLIRGRWWEDFHDPGLNELEEQVTASNQNVAQAEAQFRSARAAIRGVRADLFPTVTAGVSADKAHASANRALTRGFTTGTTTDYQLPIDFSYELDVWGRVRSSVATSVANAQASAADLQSVLISIESELASDYFQLRGLDAQRALLDATIAAYETALRVTTNRYNQGVVSGSDVAQAQTQLDTTRAQATDLAVARAEFEHAIAILVGKAPSELTIASTSNEVTPPAIPIALPLELVERRPDVAAAERRVAAANAQIGVAKSAFFPNVALSATAGLESATLGNLLTWPSRFWSIGPSVVQTVFDGGKRRALTAEAEANYDATVAAYRQNVLTAFQDVEDNLAALRILAEEAAQQADAVRSAERSLALADNRYRAGTTTYLEVITAQSVALANQRTAVDITTRRLTASVLLIKALGGGWTAAQLPAVQ